MGSWLPLWLAEGYRYGERGRWGRVLSLDHRLAAGELSKKVLGAYARWCSSGDT